MAEETEQQTQTESNQEPQESSNYSKEDTEFLIGATPVAETAANVHTFLNNVALADDTTKTGYLRDEELGMPKLTVRSCKELSLISDKIMNNDFFKDYFASESEITTATSLSRDAKLITLAVMQKREIADVTKRPSKPNKGWFHKKDNNAEQQIQ